MDDERTFVCTSCGHQETIGEAPRLCDLGRPRLCGECSGLMVIDGEVKPMMFIEKVFRKERC